MANQLNDHRCHAWTSRYSNGCEEEESVPINFELLSMARPFSSTLTHNLWHLMSWICFAFLRNSSDNSPFISLSLNFLKMVFWWRKVFVPVKVISFHTVLSINCQVFARRWLVDAQWLDTYLVRWVHLNWTWESCHWWFAYRNHWRLTMTRRGNLGISVRVPLYEMSTRWTRGVCLQMGVCIHRSSCVDVKKVRSADVELGEIAGWTLKCAWQDFKMDRRPCSCAVPWTGQILMKPTHLLAVCVLR